MIPNKINQSFMQGMQVLSEAKINGSKITISKSNSIHTQTLFEKIFFRDKNITNEKNNNLNRNYEKAKNAVAAALENEIKISIMLSTNGIPAADPSLDHEIENISKSLVNKMLANETTEKGKPSNENTNVKFGRLISDISQFSKAFHPTKSNEQLIFNALSNVKEMNKFSLGDPNKFKFFKAQLNHRIETATTDNKKELNKITSNSMLSEEKIATEINTINNIADSAAWAQKNKWMDTRRAIGWTVGMNQTELRGLSNKDKFNINWKLVTSTNSKVKLNLQTWKKNLVTLASEKTEKHRKLPSFLTKSRYRIKDYKGVDERITLAPL